ncbi:MAG TPA: shikimate kinase [Candidatus Marinimicrobia bacterium]|nr:shikimate kinase [Candidatus Neomarinimicrobiota bacterium]HIL86805.1 shikimate kinase [Candidatus Neomarinimicrobiota bacterium]
MENIKQIFLIGMMGSGKSTVGSMLADKLNWTFIDIDSELEKDSGLSIKDMFKDGENTFRTYEAAKLEEVVLKDRIVCATGGGIVVEESNCKILDQSFCVYLDTSLDHLYKRIENDNSRPLLSVDNKRNIMKDIFDNREEKYKSLSKLNVNTDNKSVDDSCKTIMEYINE